MTAKRASSLTTTPVRCWESLRTTRRVKPLTRSEDQEISYESDDLDEADFLTLEREQKLATKDSEFNDLLPTRMTWMTPNRLPLRKIRG